MADDALRDTYSLSSDYSCKEIILEKIMARMPILAYHNVERAPLGVRLARLYVTPEQFEHQMWTLRRLGLRGLSVSNGVAALANSEGRGSTILTFDDGYLDNLEYAAPILKKYGFTATCYVVANRIGSHNVWDSDYLGVKKPTMSEPQLQAWLAAGMEIGSHTCTHPRLDQLDLATARQEIEHSRWVLTSLLGVPVEHFCYPYGCFNEATVELVKRAGYRSAVASLRGIARREDDLFRLPRASIHGDASWFKFLLKVATRYEDRYRSKARA